MIRRVICRIVDSGLRLVGKHTTAARWAGVRVGSGCRILTTRLGSEPWLITIGDRVTIASEVFLLTHDGATWLMRDGKGRRFRYAPIEIGNDVFVGVQSVIMPGVRIGCRVIVGAGSVVTKSVPSGVIVAGVPARVIGLYSEYEKRALEQFRSQSEVQGRTLREWSMQIAERQWQPELAVPVAAGSQHEQND